MDMNLLLSALFIGTFGFGFFIYGKKMQDLRMLALGLALMIYPYFVHSMLALWLIAAVCIGGTYLLSRFGILDAS